MAEVLSRWERRGLQQGREQGREQGLIEGMRTTLLRLIAGKQIPLDAPTEQRLRSLDREALLALADALLGFQNRADLDSWLDQIAAQE